MKKSPIWRAMCQIQNWSFVAILESLSTVITRITCAGRLRKSVQDAATLLTLK